MSTRKCFYCGNEYAETIFRTHLEQCMHRTDPNTTLSNTRQNNLMQKQSPDLLQCPKCKEYQSEWHQSASGNRFSQKHQNHRAQFRVRCNNVKNFYYYIMYCFNYWCLVGLQRNILFQM